MLNVVILTPEREIFSGDAQAVFVPGTSGEFEILSGHAPIVSSLSEGSIKLIGTGGEKEIFSIKKGFVEVLNNTVSLLVQENR